MITPRCPHDGRRLDFSCGADEHGACPRCGDEWALENADWRLSGPQWYALGIVYYSGDRDVWTGNKNAEPPRWTQHGYGTIHHRTAESLQEADLLHAPHPDRPWVMEMTPLGNTIYEQRLAERKAKGLQ